MDTRGARIAYIRKSMGLSQVAFAEIIGALRREAGKPGLSRGAIGNWELGRGIDLDNLQLLADLAGTSMDWLTRNVGEPPSEAALQEIGRALKPAPPDESVIILDERRRRFPEVIPLYGTVAASMMGRGAFLLSQEPIDTLPMMPGLVGEEGVYGLLVKGDSMYPMFSDGDPIYVSSVRQPHRGDIIVIQERDSANGQPQGFVKLFQRETAAKLFTKQFNPEADLVFERRRGIERHRVFTRRELAGVI